MPHAWLLEVQKSSSSRLEQDTATIICQQGWQLIPLLCQDSHSMKGSSRPTVVPDSHPATVEDPISHRAGCPPGKMGLAGNGKDPLPSFPAEREL